MAERIIIKGVSRGGTTITRTIVNQHPDLWITNEVSTYNHLFLHPKPREYFTHLIRPGRDSFPPGFDKANRANFPHNCMAELTKLGGDTSLNRVLAAEKYMFPGDFKYVGDKGCEISLFPKFLENGIDFKLIYIYRDGRDVIASQKKRDIPQGMMNKSYKEVSRIWAVNVGKWLEVKKQLPPDSFVEIYYRDWVFDPVINTSKIARLLNLDSHVFYSAWESKFKENKTHNQRYHKEIPNWREEFHPKAITLLEEMDLSIKA